MIEKIEKYPHEYSLQDEYGYTDADLVKKLNEVIDVVNMILEQLKEQKPIKAKEDFDLFEWFCNHPPKYLKEQNNE